MSNTVLLKPEFVFSPDQARWAWSARHKPTATADDMNAFWDKTFYAHGGGLNYSDDDSDAELPDWTWDWREGDSVVDAIRWIVNDAYCYRTNEGLLTLDGECKDVDTVAYTADECPCKVVSCVAADAHAAFGRGYSEMVMLKLGLCRDVVEIISDMSESPFKITSLKTLSAFEDLPNVVAEQHRFHESAQRYYDALTPNPIRMSCDALSSRDLFTQIAKNRESHRKTIEFILRIVTT